MQPLSSRCISWCAGRTRIQSTGKSKRRMLEMISEREEGGRKHRQRIVHRAGKSIRQAYDSTYEYCVNSFRAPGLHFHSFRSHHKSQYAANPRSYPLHPPIWQPIANDLHSTTPLLLCECSLCSMTTSFTLLSWPLSHSGRLQRLHLQRQIAFYQSANDSQRPL